MKARMAWLLLVASVYSQSSENPSSLQAQLDLAKSYATKWIPGLKSDENQGLHEFAVKEFKSVLVKDSANAVALAWLANLAYNSAGADSGEQQSADFADALKWNRRRIAAHPSDADAYYQIGVIAWAQAFGPTRDARIKAGMTADTTGPITNLTDRMELESKFSKDIEEGIASLKKAVELNPQNPDPMSYLNLLLREKAYLETSAELSEADIAEAEEWTANGVAARNRRVALGATIDKRNYEIPRAPPPPPPPPPLRDPNMLTPVKIGGQIAEQNLVRKVEPVYPDLARNAKVEGVVQFTALINAQGDVVNLQLVRGHPLLVMAAKDAITQWKYRPVLLNGNPVPVVTNIVVNFSLSN